MKNWSNSELCDHLGDFFEERNKCYLISLPHLNRLLLDPRCPSAHQSNLVEYLLKLKQKMDNSKQ